MLEAMLGKALGGLDLSQLTTQFNGLLAHHEELLQTLKRLETKIDVLDAKTDTLGYKLENQNAS